MVRIVGLLGFLAAVGLTSGCSSQQGEAAPKKDKGSGFASDREGEGTPETIFDSKRAMGYLDEICKIGPRISGTAGMKKQQELLLKHFGNCGAKVQKQTFFARQVSRPRPTEMTNLIISWHPERTRRVILCSHYDTRPIADQEPDPRDWRKPFLSANDGGSGVALLMELANHMKDLPTNVGVDFVLFDGEEYIWDPRRDNYFIGSRHFAQKYAQGVRTGEAHFRYIAAILLDMIAGQNASFPAEGTSALKAGPLVSQVWGIAAELKCPAFLNRIGDSVLDDHVELNRAGIPAIDIIDWENYRAHWHRLSDVPENCSRDPMEQVARVLIVWLKRVK